MDTAVRSLCGLSHLVLPGQPVTMLVRKNSSLPNFNVFLYLEILQTLEVSTMFYSQRPLNPILKFLIIVSS